MALSAIAQHFGRPGTPIDQAWIESLNGHNKAEYPHLLAIRDPAIQRAEIAVVRGHYNTVRPSQGVGYVTPDDEHEGRGEAIRKAHQVGLEQARLQRFARHRKQRENSTQQGAALLFNTLRITIANSETRQVSEIAGVRVGDLCCIPTCSCPVREPRLLATHRAAHKPPASTVSCPA